MRKLIQGTALNHSTTAGRTVLLTIKLSPPAPQPVSIRFEGISPPVGWPPVLEDGGRTLSGSSVIVPAGSSRAFIPVPIPYDPAMAGETHGTNILINPGQSAAACPTLIQTISPKATGPGEAGCRTMEERRVSQSQPAHTPRPPGPSARKSLTLRAPATSIR